MGKAGEFDTAYFGQMRYKGKTQNHVETLYVTPIPYSTNMQTAVNVNFLV